jgi:tetratricopeptide (TPR) repeat protein
VGRDFNLDVKYILPAEEPPLFVNVPLLPPHFVGRDDLVESLVTQLVAGNTLSLSAEGLPGVGKTTLAVALAHHRRLLEHFSDGVLWAGLGQQPDMLGALASWAESLHIDVTHLVTEAKRAQAVKNAIGQRRLLLVIDDAWSYDAARFLHCGGPNCCHLLTTRNQSIARKFAGPTRTTSVPELQPDPAFALLQALAPEACAADSQTARELSQAVGGLPLALELLGGYLAEPEHAFFTQLTAEAWEEMRDPQRRLQLASQRLGTGFASPQVTLQETIELSLSGLPSQAVAAFYALGAFAPKPEQFTLEAAQTVTETDTRTLALLASRNLAERVGAEWLALHQTLADVASTRMDAEAVVRHMVYYLALAQRNPEDWQTIEANYGQAKWAWERLPEDEAVLGFLWTFGIYHQRRGLWRDYLAWAERGLAVAEAKEQKESAATLLNNLGWVYDALGQKPQALDYYQRALPIRQEVGDRAGEAATLNNIGKVYDDLGQKPQALDYYQRALPIRQEVGDRAGEATTLNNIGKVYSALGQNPQALDYYQRALSISQEVGNREGESVTRYNVAMIYVEQGRLAEAVAELRQVVALDEAVQHPDLEQDLAKLAQAEAMLAAQQRGGKEES